jgi:hypothetical protein
MEHKVDEEKLKIIAERLLEKQREHNVELMIGHLNDAIQEGIVDWQALGLEGTYDEIIDALLWINKRCGY